MGGRGRGAPGRRYKLPGVYDVGLETCFARSQATNYATQYPSYPADEDRLLKNYSILIKVQY